MKQKVLTLLLTLLMPTFLLAGNVKGYVKDSETQEPLIGASVVVDGTTSGVVTDINGYFELFNIPSGEQIVVASYMGYVPDSLKIDGSQAIKHTFFLQSESFVMNEVVVSVQAKGQLSAINQQLKASSISNIVSSEKIRELPDANVAESLGRLPGVKIESSNGEGDKVTIRGLEPRYNLITINGVRAPASGNNDNSVSMAGISPFMIDGIEVQKSLTPDKDADVIGGIVDLKLKDAEAGFHVNALVQNSFAGELPGDNVNPFATLQLSNRFLDNKLGVILVGSYDKKNRISHEADNSGTLIESSKLFQRTNSSFRHGSIVRERTGGNLFIDYKVDGFKVQASGFVSALGDEAVNRSHNISGPGQQTRTINVRNLNTLTSVYSLKLEKDIYNTKLNFTLSYNKSKNETPKDYNVTTKNLVLASSANFDSVLFAMPEIDFIRDNLGQTGNITSYEIGQLINEAKLLPGTQAIGDSAYYISSLGSNKSIFTEDALTVNLDYQVPLSLGSQVNGFIKVGGRYSSKNREYDARNFSTGTADGTPGVAFANSVRNTILPDMNFNDNANILGGADRLAPYHMYDDFEEAIIDGGYTLSGYMAPRYVEEILSAVDAANWTISESATQESNKRGSDYFGSEIGMAGYIMGDLNLTSYVKLVGGVRYEKLSTEYVAFGTFATGSGTTALDSIYGPPGNRENDYLLPMVNAKIMPFDWMDVRLAYTQSLARPTYNAFLPGYTVDRDKNLSNIGNPELMPAVSENFDAYLTFNGRKLGLFTLGGFIKRIDGFEYYRNYNPNNPLSLEKISALLSKYDEYLLTPARLNGDYGNLSNIWGIPINNEYDSYVKGIEVDFQTTFWYLPKPFNGITFSANYTFNESEQTEVREKIDSIIRDPRGFVIGATYKDSTYTRTLSGQPRHIFNAQMGYDYKGFSVRVSYMYTQQTYAGINGTAQLGFNNYNATLKKWDLSLSQQIPWVKGLQVFVNASNLNNQITGSFSQIPGDLPKEKQIVGFTPEKSVGGNDKYRYPLSDRQYSNFIITGLKYRF